MLGHFRFLHLADAIVAAVSRQLSASYLTLYNIYSFMAYCSHKSNWIYTVSQKTYTKQKRQDLTHQKSLKLVNF